jgi:hypothetical protein
MYSRLEVTKLANSTLGFGKGSMYKVMEQVFMEVNANKDSALHVQTQGYERWVSPLLGTLECRDWSDIQAIS